MKNIVCDSCGTSISSAGLRYEVSIDVRAVYDDESISLMDLVRDHRQDLLDLIEQMEAQEKSSEEVEESIYKALQLDLCPRCQKSYIQNPITPNSSPADGLNPELEKFIRSLKMKRKPDQL
jgi:hypothetical protein